MSHWVCFSANGPRLTLASGPPDSDTLKKNSKQAWIPEGKEPMYDLGVFAFINLKIHNFNFHHENNCVLRTSRQPLTWPVPHLGYLSRGKTAKHNY